MCTGPHTRPQLRLPFLQHLEHRFWCTVLSSSNFCSHHEVRLGQARRLCPQWGVLVGTRPGSLCCPRPKVKNVSFCSHMQESPFQKERTHVCVYVDTCVHACVRVCVCICVCMCVLLPLLLPLLPSPSPFSFSSPSSLGPGSPDVVRTFLLEDGAGPHVCAEKSLGCCCICAHALKC